MNKKREGKCLPFLRNLDPPPPPCKISDGKRQIESSEFVDFEGLAYFFSSVWLTSLFNHS